MKRVLGIGLVMALASVVVWAEGSPKALGLLRNARYVYVTSYDGNEFNPNILSDDRDAILAVQDAIKKSGKYVIVYEPNQADIILRVMSRGSDDLLAVYDARGHEGNYLWRTEHRDGLQKDETPLVKEFLGEMAKFSK
jgi:hypothetical protein